MPSYRLLYQRLRLWLFEAVRYVSMAFDAVPLNVYFTREMIQPVPSSSFRTTI
jgi:hypothetical protein